MKIEDFVVAERLSLELHDRFKLVPWDRWWWRPRPARVRIAVYAEGPIRFDGGGFDGLQHMIGALKADPWWWVTFELTLIHRGTDSSADEQNKRLDQIVLSDYDELWLFGLASGNLLSSGERAAVHAFMDAGGGVLHTGDHASLGQGIAGNIKRVGKLRQYPAPAATAPVWNNTLREGPTPGYQFVDQSDDVPQRIRLRRYPVWSSYPNWFWRRQPHPILCGLKGPIDVFPDHQHEGEAIAPSSYPGSEWPSKSGFQPKVDVIAWGRILSPDADAGRELGLVSVYNGHRADVGRIVADSTWHHWFDINLDGFAASASGRGHLDEILNYFLNCAVWLAPPGRQRAMRNAMLWGGIWRHPFVDWTERLHPRWLGAQARDVFSRYAPQCTLYSWILDLIPIHVVKDLRIAIPHSDVEFPIAFEELVLGTALAPLVEHVQKSNGIPARGPELDLVDVAFAQAVPKALKSLQGELGVFGKHVQAAAGAVGRRPKTKKHAKAVRRKPANRTAKKSTKRSTKKSTKKSSRKSTR